MSQEPPSTILKLNRSVNFTPGPIAESYCAPSQIQFPMNHLSADSCSGSICAAAALAGWASAKADNAKSAKGRMTIFTVLDPLLIFAMPVSRNHLVAQADILRRLDADHGTGGLANNRIDMRSHPSEPFRHNSPANHNKISVLLFCCPANYSRHLTAFEHHLHICAGFEL